MLALKLLLEVLEESVVKVLTSKVGVSGGGLDSEDTTRDGEERHIKGSSSKVEDEHELLLLGLGGRVVESVRDGSGGGLVDDTEHVKTGNETSVLGQIVRFKLTKKKSAVVAHLGGQSLRVVEVGGDGNDGLLDGLAELGLSGLTELGEDHGGDLSGGELLGLTEVLDLDEGGALLVDDLERPVNHVLLNIGIVETTTNETLGVEHSLTGVHRGLVPKGIR